MKTFLRKLHVWVSVIGYALFTGLLIYALFARNAIAEPLAPQKELHTFGFATAAYICRRDGYKFVVDIGHDHYVCLLDAMGAPEAVNIAEWLAKYESS